VKERERERERKRKRENERTCVYEREEACIREGKCKRERERGGEGAVQEREIGQW